MNIDIFGHSLTMFDLMWAFTCVIYMIYLIGQPVKH